MPRLCRGLSHRPRLTARRRAKRSRTRKPPRHHAEIAPSLRGARRVSSAEKQLVWQGFGSARISETETRCLSFVTKSPRNSVTGKPGGRWERADAGRVGKRLRAIFAPALGTKLRHRSGCTGESKTRPVSLWNGVGFCPNLLFGKRAGRFRDRPPKAGCRRAAGTLRESVRIAGFPRCGTLSGAGELF